MAALTDMFMRYSWTQQNFRSNAPTNSRRIVVGWVYAVDPRTKEIKVLCTRKVPEGTRVNRSTTGAAGTDPKYWGKWGSFGGTAGNNSRHAADAVVNEIVHEGGFSRIPELATLSYKDMILPGRASSLSGRNLMTIKFYDHMNYIDIFIIQFPWWLFVKICPSDMLMRDWRIFRESYQEIDMLVQLSMSDIYYYQTREVHTHHNNFMLGYAIDTFMRYLHPYLVRTNWYFARKWWNLTMPCVRDTRGRRPTWDW